MWEYFKAACLICIIFPSTVLNLVSWDRKEEIFVIMYYCMLVLLQLRCQGFQVNSLLLLTVTAIDLVEICTAKWPLWQLLVFHKDTCLHTEFQ